MNDGLPAEYWEACRLAQQGDYDEARRVYGGLVDGAAGRLRALVANDLAVLTVMEGRLEEGMQGWEDAIEADNAF